MLYSEKCKMLNGTLETVKATFKFSYEKDDGLVYVGYLQLSDNFLNNKDQTDEFYFFDKAYKKLKDIFPKTDIKLDDHSDDNVVYILGK